MSRTFQDNLRSSLPAVAAVAGVYIRAGIFDVRVPALHVPESYDDSVSDSGDLFVRKAGTDDWKVIEVKSYRVDTDTLSRYPMIIVDKCSTFERKGDKPAFYYAVGSDLKSAMVFDLAKYESQMTKHKHKDQVHGTLMDCWVAPQKLWRRVAL